MIKDSYYYLSCVDIQARFLVFFVRGKLYKMGRANKIRILISLIKNTSFLLYFKLFFVIFILIFTFFIILIIQ
jgi:hypothetical protein